MPKRFITERDIGAYSAQGMTELVIEPDMVLTDMAVERARAAKIRLIRPDGVSTPPVSAVASDATSPLQSQARSEVHAQVRAAVIARLGGEPEGLDAIIAAVLPRVS